MEHINTSQGPLGLKLPAFLFPEKLFSSGFDGIFTITMILFGMAGCLYVLYLQSGVNHQLKDNVVLTASIPTNIPEIRPAVAVIAKNREQPRYVNITGARKAGSALSFTIDAFDQAASYEFDFGNGKKVIATGQVTEYAFKRSGVYKVALAVTYQGEKRNIEVGPVWVK